MKTYCKNIDVENVKTIYPHVLGCFDGKWRRSDFQKLLSEYSDKSADEIRRLIDTGQKAELFDDVKRIAQEISRRIHIRELRLDPISYSQRRDGISGKLRIIGVESVMHQCCDHVAVGCMRELFDAKAGYYQCASIKNKGQVFGKNAIQKFIRQKNAAMRNAREYGRKHSNRAAYFVKLDVKKCYPSMRRVMLMGLLDRDIHKNKTLLWFVNALLEMHTNGLTIGSLLSQFLCNYALSYVYREVASLHKERRGKKSRLVEFQLFYMDDMLFMGSSRRDLKMAVRHIERYMRDKLGLTIKPTWHIKQLAREPIDMMGYVIHADVHVTIRASIFLRARRAFALAKRRMNIDIARRVVSYRGYFVHSDSKTIIAKLHVDRIAHKAQRFISDFEKKKGVIA
ncbi:hypothetical protein FACS18948_6610 [Clostridia bacterium]|nr:hypothetical protein FACS18948_6610 [Clostridia bacterium]